MGESYKKILTAVLAGTIVGYIASLFVPAKTKTDHKKKVKNIALSINKIYQDENERERIKEAFEKYTKESVATYRQAKKNFVINLAKLKATAETIDKSKYKDVLTKTIKQIASQQSVSVKQFDKFKTMLLSDFDKLKSALN